MTVPAVCVTHALCVCLGLDQCVTRDREPCSHLAPVAQQLCFAVHPNLARPIGGQQGCVENHHTQDKILDKHKAQDSELWQMFEVFLVP